MYNGGYRILMKYVTRSNGLELSNPTATAKGQTILPRNLQYSSLRNSAIKYLGNGNFEALTRPPSDEQGVSSSTFWESDFYFLILVFLLCFLSAMTSQSNCSNRRRADQTTKARSFLSGSLVFFPNHKLLCIVNASIVTVKCLVCI